MKKDIFTIIYFTLILVLPAVFAINGLGVTTWQWWTLLLGMAFSNATGMVIGSCIDDDDDVK